MDSPGARRRSILPAHRTWETRMAADTEIEWMKLTAP